MGQDLNDVLVFTRVVDEGSFTRAAKSLGLPKSTVSRRVTRLEDRLGARLLQRTTRKLSLTDAGRAYYARGARIVADLEDADRAVTEMQSAPRGRLRVTAPVELGVALGPLINTFLSTYPEVQIELDLTGRYVDLVQEGYDVAVRAGALSDSTLVARKLSESWLQLVASPAYLDRRGTPTRIEDLREHDCVIFAPYSTNAHWRLRGPRGEVSVPVHGRIAANHFDVVRSAAVAGFGIALVPETVAKREVDAGLLRVVLPDVCPPVGLLSIVYPSGRHLPSKTRAFVDWLLERYSAELMFEHYDGPA